MIKVEKVDGEQAKVSVKGPLSQLMPEACMAVSAVYDCIKDSAHGDNAKEHFLRESFELIIEEAKKVQPDITKNHGEGESNK